jgi:hypothetical protein
MKPHRYSKFDALGLGGLPPAGAYYVETPPQLVRTSEQLVRTSCQAMPP